MLIKSRALMLHTFKHSDTMSVAVLFTEERGTASFVVRIPKTRRTSGKSKLFQPLSLLSIEWDDRDTLSLQHLRSVQSLYPYADIPYEPMKSAIALFLSEFLYHSLRGEQSGQPLFDYLYSSLQWLDVARTSYANFHLVFLLRLSRFLGFYPNTDDFSADAVFDMQNSCFTRHVPTHPYYIGTREAAALPLLLRMNYETMHLFRFSRTERSRLLQILNDYYRLHVPGFPSLKSLDVLHDVFS